MVTLGSIQPSTFQPFHGSAPYDGALDFRGFELTLNEIPGVSSSSEEAQLGCPLEGVQELSKPARRDSIIAPPMPTETSPSEVADKAGRLSSTRPTYTHRLFRSAKPEQKSWHSHAPSDDGSAIDEGIVSAGLGASSSSTLSPGSGIDFLRSRASSWHASDIDRRRSPPSRGLPLQQQQQQQQQQKQHQQQHQQQQPDLGGHGGATRSPPRSGRRGCEDSSKPANEILDGSDVLQQISNLTSTEPSNEREVFVGGLRESEDSIHITEEELATYFSKFGIIESVSINRDDRTHRGRGFAFVKFFQESAALNAVVADASTHVIRGTTVSVQWSRGAKDGGSDRPRRRHSATSATSSNGNGNGNSPSHGTSRSSSKMGMFSHKGGGGSGGIHRGGNSGGGSSSCASCGSVCSHSGYSPMRSRNQGHLLSGPGGSGCGGGGGGSVGGMPYAYNGHGGEHANQQMVCVVVPAQRAAALGLAHHPAHHSRGVCTSRSSPPRDIHFTPLAQSNSSGGGGGHSVYSSQSRTHSHSGAPISGGVHGSGGGYGHHSPPHSVDHHLHHAINATPSHHTLPKANSRGSYGGGGGAPPKQQQHMPPPGHHHDSRRLPPPAEPRGYSPVAATGGGGGGGGGGSFLFSDYDRPKYDIALLPSTSYPPSGWSVEGGTGSSRSFGRGGSATRAQSPPNMLRSATHGSRNGGGVPRPPPTPPTGYDNQYPSSSRYSLACPGSQQQQQGGSRAGLDKLPPLTGLTGRRHSGSSAMPGRSSLQQDALAAASGYLYSADDIGNEHPAYERDYHSYPGGSSHLP